MIQEDPDMLKNQISPMIEKNTPSRSARRNIFDGINESKIRVRMRKLSQSEVFPKQEKSQSQQSILLTSRVCQHDTW
jgi:hypothetical protein